MVTSTFRSLAVRRWVAVGCAAVLALIVAAWLSNGAISRMARERVLRGLREAFASELEFKKLEISVFPQLRMAGEGLALHYRGRPDLPPLIAIRRFTANASLITLVSGRVQQVRLEGLVIQVPPKGERGPQQQK